MNAPAISAEILWRCLLDKSFEVADRSTVAPDRTERDRLLAEAVELYQTARRLMRP